MDKWFIKNTKSLENKIIAVTGATGGIGEPLCNFLLKLNATLILMDRNREKSLKLIEKLKKRCVNANVFHITTDLSSIISVKKAVEELKKYDIDVFIHNAGAYSIPRFKADSGYDNVFTINFISPYYIIRSLLPCLQKKGGKVVAMGSIAYRYSKTDADDIDFSLRKRASLVYGNAKRFLMFSLFELFKEKSGMLSVVHPGITFTGITNHYPKLIYKIIKYPMKVIFMKPEKACLSALTGIFKRIPYQSWTGPCIFDIWGRPKTRKLRISDEESKFIGAKAEEIYDEQVKKYKTFSL